MKVLIAIALFFVAGFFLLSAQNDTLPDRLNYQATTFTKFEADHPQNTLFKIYKFRANDQMIVIYELDSPTTNARDNYINQSKTNFRNQGFKLTELDPTADYMGIKGDQAIFHTLVEYKGVQYPALLMVGVNMPPDSATAAATIQAMKKIKLL